MTPPRASTPEEHSELWREPLQVVSGWADASQLSPALLKHKARGEWWSILEQTETTLLISREYEHLLLALTVADGKPKISFMPLPHPSGIAYDADRGIVHVASTRNPNQILELGPVTGVLPRADRPVATPPERPLVPLRSRFLPGASYIHDLAMIDGVLHANAVGENAVVRIDGDDPPRRVWWPRCVEVDGEPAIDRNYIQLNSIAAGDDISSSFFSASAEKISARRPGHRNFPVDGRGVIFSGETREPIVRGLTRPHSARLHEGRVWVDNSGYGQTGVVADGGFEPVAQLPGWTRGLGFADDFAFVATSRVIPRFRQYAPGLDVERAHCGVHAIDPRSGKVLGSIEWPHGNQVFALELVPRRFTLGFPLFKLGRQSTAVRDLFYAFAPNPTEVTT
jgi:uncharacterized protein (TIGR03032 family)